MCCGKELLLNSYKQTRIPSRTIIQADAAPKSPSAPAQRVASNSVVFTYVGQTGITVVSPISGKHYRFGHSGTRLEVDPRDCSWMKFVPGLERL